MSSKAETEALDRGHPGLKEHARWGTMNDDTAGSVNKVVSIEDRIHAYFRNLILDNKPIEGNYSDPQLGLPKAPSSDFFTKLASDYAKDELLKRFWNGKRSENSPSVPASPDAGIELIPSGTLEPTPG